MQSIKFMAHYAESIGGIFTDGEIEAIPYNHWKRDMEWMVLVVESPKYGAFIPVEAYTAREAALKAIEEFIILKEDEDE